MKLFNLNLETTVLRLYLMMLVVIVAGFSGIWALSFLALPIFLSCLLGLDLSAKNLQIQSRSLTQSMLKRIKNLRLPIHHTA